MLIKDNNPERDYWDVLKGIGVICIVIGHCWMKLQNFVYLFHIPMFFFISGYMYSERKYGDDPFLNMSNRIKSSWLKYVFLMITFILLHNNFNDVGMLTLGGGHYEKIDVLQQCAKAVVGCADEFLVSPLWFVPVLILTSTLLGFVVYVSRILEKIFRTPIIKFLFQFIVVVVSSVFGYFLIERQIFLAANIQIAFAALPFLWLGYVVRNYLSEFKRFLNIGLTIIFLIILIYVSKDYLMSFINAIVFEYMYITAVMGIYVCMYLAKIIAKVDWIKRCFILLGRESFFMMATHYFVLRVFDKWYSLQNEALGQEYYNTLPVSNDEFVPIYLLLGILLPTIVFVIYDFVVHKMRSYFAVRKEL